MRLAPGYLKSIRRQFAAYCSQKKSETPLRKILMVGAVLGDDGLIPADRNFLKTTMEKLQSIGADIAPDCEIEVLNFEEKQGSEDFLNGTYQADIVIICHVRKATSIHSGNSPNITSPLAGEPGIWRKSVMSTGARAVMVFFEQESAEVSAALFLNGDGSFIPAKQGRTQHMIWGDLLLAGSFAEQLRVRPVELQPH